MSGLSPLFGRSALSRAFQRAGIDPDAITRHDIEQLMPAIEQVLTVFLKPDDVKVRLQAIATLQQGRKRPA
jgi:hypothetical protein